MVSVGWLSSHVQIARGAAKPGGWVTGQGQGLMPHVLFVSSPC